MSEGQLPSNVHVLSPRKMSLSDRLDRFLERHALAPNETPIRRDPTRPNAPGINAITCASCGQAEYLTRDYCRCGHYLRGQLEDEFLAWEVQISEDHERLKEALNKRLKRLRYLYGVSLPFLIAPLAHLAFFSESLSFIPMVSMAVGFAIMGACALAEQNLRKPVEASLRFQSHYDFETFLEFRFLHLMRVNQGDANDQKTTKKQ